MNIKVLHFLLIILSCFFLYSCQQDQRAENTLKVGTITGPETELMEVAKKIALEKHNLEIIIVPFNDYAMPNIALNDGSIDANMFQTISYLDADSKIHDYKFAIIGKTFIFPMAIYSKKVKSLNDIPNKAIVAIPNDPSNGARALLLLEKAKLITLKPSSKTFISAQDIKDNPKQLKLEELDAAQLPRVLSDVTLAIINTNYAVPAGLIPARDGLFVEDKNSPYVNVVVAKFKNRNDPRLKALVEALHSPEVRKAAQTIFQGQAIEAWNE